jgi:GTPase SAR1 family protein
MVYIFRRDNDKTVKKLGQLDIQANKRIFVYGLSGAGKTTFIEAFLNESSHYCVENLKGTLSYVPQ